eukprot:5773878-Prymnesium_polylepis.1
MTRRPHVTDHQSPHAQPAWLRWAASRSGSASASACSASSPSTSAVAVEPRRRAFCRISKSWARSYSRTQRPGCLLCCKARAFAKQRYSPATFHAKPGALPDS